ncbi:hypothetical protein EGW08_016854 [Elysia chlorotica]|uniref:L-Fucosyltransferase n=1 Tax=Elysia chlorotica TaxID=188477 RepID=A0A433T1H0_ELYCH|nr:hypothetical protein EGW08_016854 [Elysia chlorotica]
MRRTVGLTRTDQDVSKEVNRVQISISSNDDVSISRSTTRSSGCGSMMKFKRGPRCYAILGTLTLCMLILYLGDFSYIFAILNKKVHVERHVLRWEDHQHKVDHMRPRIMIGTRGRMGNHMFQYATLNGLARRYNMTPIMLGNLDILDVFKLPTLQGDFSLLRDPITYTELKASAYNPGVDKIDPTRDVYLNGYYQSWKYHDHMRAELLDKHFVLLDPIKEAADRYIASLLESRKKQGATLVAIHVRRGDFVRQRVKGYTAAPIPYYYRAMNYFRKKYGNVMFIICTNDLVWAETNLEDEGGDVHYSHETDGALDLAIMMACHHMIITSGSYSWWAGYLVRGEVIYYMGYPQPNTKIGNLTNREDYYPPYWEGRW